jgi:hypothetical protein
MKKVIHQGFDFAQLGGFPLNQQRLEWMQTAYAELSGGLAAMFGDNVIVSGCIVSGQSVSDGWIVVNGELLPFLGSQTGVLDTFLIRTELTPLTFKDASSKSVQFRKYAQFGTSSDAIAWNTLKRLASYTDISAHISRTDNPHGVTKSQVGLSNLPNAISDSTSLASSTTLATSKAVSIVSTAVTNLGNRFTLKRYVLSVNPGTGIYQGVLDSGYSLYTGIFADFGRSYMFAPIGWVWYENGDIKYKFEKRNADSSGSFTIDVLYVTQ